MALAVAAALAQLAAQLIDYQVYELRLLLLDSNKHRSLFGVASLLAHAFAVAAAFAGTVLGPRRLAWAVLCFTLSVLLVLRALVGFHLLQAAPLVLVVFAIVWWFSLDASRGRPHAADRARPARGLVRRARRRTQQRDDVLRPAASWEYQIRGMVKHTASLSGWILLGSGLASVALRRGTSRMASPSG